MILQARTSTLDMLQKLLREAPEYLKNVLPSKLPWQPPRQGLHAHHGPWEDLYPLPGVLSGLPLTSRESHRGLQAHTQAPSSPFLPAYLIFPRQQPALPKRSQTVPPSKAHRLRRAQPDTGRDNGHSPSVPPQHPTLHAGITVLEEIKSPATAAGNPARQAGRGIHSLLQTLSGAKKDKPKSSTVFPLPPLHPLVQKM